MKNTLVSEYDCRARHAPGREEGERDRQTKPHIQFNARSLELLRTLFLPVDGRAH